MSLEELREQLLRYGESSNSSVKRYSTKGYIGLRFNEERKHPIGFKLQTTKNRIEVRILHTTCKNYLREYKTTDPIIEHDNVYYIASEKDIPLGEALIKAFIENKTS